MLIFGLGPESAYEGRFQVSNSFSLGQDRTGRHGCYLRTSSLSNWDINGRNISRHFLGLQVSDELAVQGKQEALYLRCPEMRLPEDLGTAQHWTK